MSSFESVDFFFQDEKEKYQIVLAGAVRDENAKGQPPGLDTVKALRVLDQTDVEKLALFDENLEAIGRYTQVKYV